MPKVHRLPNHVSFVCDERPGTRMVAATVLIGQGSTHEPPHERGLTNLVVQASAAGGTLTRSREDVIRQVEYKGGAIEVIAGAESVSYGALSAAEHVKEAFGVLADIIRNPVFDDKSVETCKAEVLADIVQGTESGEEQADLLFYEAALGPRFGNKAGAPERLAPPPSSGAANDDGDSQPFNTRMMRERHKELLSDPSRIVVSFSGDIKTAEAEALVVQCFGDIPPAPTPFREPAFSYNGGEVRHEMASEQVNIILGFPAPAAGDKGEQAAIMLEYLLGGGFSSPLFTEIRTKRGLVYGVASEYEPFRGAGLLNISASCNAENAGAVLDTIADVLETALRDGFSEEKMAKARTTIMRRRKRQGEELTERAVHNSEAALKEDVAPSPAEQERRLEAVTSDDVRRVLAQMLQSPCTLARAGAVEDLPPADALRQRLLALPAGVELPPAPSPVPSAISGAFSALAEDPAPSSIDAPVHVTVLDNGLTVMTVERPDLTLTCKTFVGTGSANEKPEDNGVAHLTEHMVFRGTASYPDTADLEACVEGELGGKMNASTTLHFTTFELYDLDARGLRGAVHALGEITFLPRLQEKKLNGDGEDDAGERGAVMEEMGDSADNPAAVGFQAALAATYPMQPWGRPVLGTHETLPPMSIEQVRNFHNTWYAPNNAAIVAVGPVKHEDHVALAGEILGHLPRKNLPPQPPAPRFQDGVTHVSPASAQTTEMTLWIESVPAAHPDSVAYEIANFILGGAKSSRLYRELALEQEICIGAGSYTQQCGALALLGIALELEPENTAAAAKAVFRVISDMAKNVTQEELDGAKAQMRLGVRIALQTSDAVCRAVGEEHIEHGRPISVGETFQEIDRVTLDDVKRVTGALLKSPFHAYTVSPQGTDYGLLPSYRELEAARFTQQAPRNPMAIPAPETPKRRA